MITVLLTIKKFYKIIITVKNQLFFKNDNCNIKY